jgi:1-acyl-sn-glycerol-3-phosphate acyltransferase
MAGQIKRPNLFLWVASIVWLNTAFWLAVLLLTLVFITIGVGYVGLFHLITQSRRRTMWLVRRMISHYGSLALACCWPLVRVRYIDYAPDDQPPFVFICNHPSTADPFLMSVLPFESIQLRKAWTAKIPVYGPVGRIAGYLTALEMPHDAFMAAGSKLLAEGVSIIAFPEGTRSGSRQMASFHGAAFRLAQHNGVKIVPLAISGSEHIHQRGSWFMRPAQVVVSKLRALTREQYENMSPFKLKTTVREQLRQYLDAQPA